MKNNNRQTPFVWQKSQWQQLQRSKKIGKLAHAILLSGVQGLGKLSFASAFSHSLLCEHVDAEGIACGQCRHCHLVRRGTHPDCMFVETEGIDKPIKINQIRQVSDFLTKSSCRGSYRIVLITSADSMNIPATNALLKTLEEPGEATLLLLVSHRVTLLPATIRSRCCCVPFYPVYHDEAVSWLAEQVNNIDVQLPLALSHGAPLKALSLLKGDQLKQRDAVLKQFVLFNQQKIDPISLAQAYLEFELSDVIEWLSYWLFDQIKMCLGVEQSGFVNIDYLKAIKAFSRQCSVNKLFILSDKLTTANRLLFKGSNPNKQLLLEDLLVAWC